MRRIFLALLVGLMATLPARAADRWTVDPAQSRLGFVATQGGEPFNGHFARFDADILFDPADLVASQVTVSIDMTSATTGDATKDGALPQPVWFHTALFPQAQFATTRFRRMDGNAYEADATLGIRGTEMAVMLPFTLDIDGTIARVAGELVIDRTDYDVGQGEFATGAVIGVDVRVEVELVAVRDAP